MIAQVRGAHGGAQSGQRAAGGVRARGLGRAGVWLRWRAGVTSCAWVFLQPLILRMRALAPQLEEQLRKGQPTKDLAHRLRGDAKTSGADSLSELVLEFQNEPDLGKIEGLRLAFKGTVARLRTDGILQ